MRRGYKKAARHGFTLVEFIVVLVILAILLAILVPSMTQWIAKAKYAGVKQECRQCVLAAQTYAAEYYAKDESLTFAACREDILTLAEAPDGATITRLAASGGTVTALTYCSANKVFVTYKDGAYTIGGQTISDSVLADPEAALLAIFNAKNKQNTRTVLSKLQESYNSKTNSGIDSTGPNWGAPAAKTLAAALGYSEADASGLYFFVKETSAGTYDFYIVPQVLTAADADNHVSVTVLHYVYRYDGTSGTISSPAELTGTVSYKTLSGTKYISVSF